MSRLAIPLRYRTLASTGDTLLRAELDLAIKTRSGTWEDLTFRVDPGTEMTTMQAADAQALNLSYSQRAIPQLNLRGQEVRPGYLRAQVLGMDGTEYVFPCYFLGDPAAPLSTASATLPRGLLGLSGVINQLRISFDGDPGLGAPFGYLIVEKK